MKILNPRFYLEFLYLIDSEEFKLLDDITEIAEIEIIKSVLQQIKKFFSKRKLKSDYLKDLKDQYQKELMIEFKRHHSGAEGITEVKWSIMKLIFVVAYFTKDKY